MRPKIGSNENKQTFYPPPLHALVHALLSPQAMLDEVDGPMNFTQMVTLFASKMAGGSDDDDVILASFEAFEMDGKIDADAFRHSLMTFGVKFSASEVDDAFAEMKIDEGMIDAAHLKGLMVSK